MVALSQVLNDLTNELKPIDKNFATQFKLFKTNIAALDRKVKSDQETFNSSRRQSLDNSVAVGGNYYGRQYDRQVGGRLGVTNSENHFAYMNGVSRYI